MWTHASHKTLLKARSIGSEPSEGNTMKKQRTLSILFDKDVDPGDAEEFAHVVTIHSFLFLTWVFFRLTYKGQLHVLDSEII
jgi:hypothetical protein